ncbi:hypothetical protein ACFSQU_18035 [Massilia sp. GCM10020059]|uniref:Uncharacterized protein n=1 Tax=Massilia agrisoli TaxID=2892444 RepID=A0ABS8IUF1_9BURK|nr:hypothetical protein [Massilia agrisoli]MCC6071442.1 hypothetical protein [Massilia agrisoli]
MNNKNSTPNSGDLSHEERVRRCAELGIVVRKSPISQARQAANTQRAQYGAGAVSGE